MVLFHWSHWNSTLIFQPVLEFTPRGEVHVLGDNVNWPGQIGLPPNNPPCGFKGDQCKPQGVAYLFLLFFTREKFTKKCDFCISDLLLKKTIERHRCSIHSSCFDEGRNSRRCARLADDRRGSAGGITFCQKTDPSCHWSILVAHLHRWPLPTRPRERQQRRGCGSGPIGC